VSGGVEARCRGADFRHPGGALSAYAARRRAHPGNKPGPPKLKLIRRRRKHGGEPPARLSAARLPVEAAPDFMTPQRKHGVHLPAPAVGRMIDRPLSAIVCLGSVFSARQRPRGTARSVGACVVEKSRRSIMPRARVRRFADQTPRANKGALPPPCPALFNQSVPRGSLGSLLSSRVGDATSYRERIARSLGGRRAARDTCRPGHAQTIFVPRACARSLARSHKAGTKRTRSPARG